MGPHERQLIRSAVEKAFAKKSPQVPKPKQGPGPSSKEVQLRTALCKYKQMLADAHDRLTPVLAKVTELRTAKEGADAALQSSKHEAEVLRGAADAYDLRVVELQQLVVKLQQEAADNRHAATGIVAAASARHVEEYAALAQQEDAMKRQVDSAARAVGRMEQMVCRYETRLADLLAKRARSQRGSVSQTDVQEVEE